MNGPDFPENDRAPRVLIGGVGYRWMRDASFGLVAGDALARLDWPAGVTVDDLGYGALLVAEDLAAADPPYDRLIVIGAVERGRPCGKAYRSLEPVALPCDAEIQERIREAGAGVIHLDHLLVIAQQLTALPPEVIVIEIEPVDTTPGTDLSPELTRLLPEVIAQVRRDALAPLRSFNRSSA